ncbi:MAG: thioesterase [Firmicutes bacterium]|nr:thioesterase [Bacillota bacterium]MCM1400714.1 thioesterase [Bacteroides sp.]MCM1476408.1 thioesterase [Bacteroides sp.]
MTENQKTYTHQFSLTAAQCNAQSELSPSMLVQHIIEVATEHADALGVGFKNLEATGTLWVLSRVAFEVERYPKLLENYSLTTWVEAYNRHFSERNFEIRGGNNEIIGFARTIWVSIDMKTRKPANLSNFEFLKDVVCDKECPIAKQGKIHPVEPPQMCHPYQFQVSDIDVNRHVNSSRYVELIINQMDLDTYDNFFVSRFEIEYRRETHYGDNVEVCSSFSADGNALISSINLDELPVCLAKTVTSPRPMK